jgi:hypothetical protein
MQALVSCPDCSGPAEITERFRLPSTDVAWFTLEQLGALIRSHRADDSVTKAISRILRADLVAVDDIGLLPVGPDAAEGLARHTGTFSPSGRLRAAAGCRHGWART